MATALDFRPPLEKLTTVECYQPEKTMIASTTF